MIDILKLRKIQKQKQNQSGDMDKPHEEPLVPEHADEPGPDSTPAMADETENAGNLPDSEEITESSGAGESPDDDQVPAEDKLELPDSDSAVNPEPETAQESVRKKSIKELLADKRKQHGGDSKPETEDSPETDTGILSQAPLSDHALNEEKTDQTENKAVPKTGSGPVKTEDKTESSTDSETEESSSTIDLVTFKLHQHQFGVNIQNVQEVVRISEITRVPNVVDYILGVTNLRGNITPVISLRQRFSLGMAEQNEDSRIIIMQLNKRSVGFLVDAVTEILHVSEADIDPPPKMVTGLDSRYITGVIKTSGNNGQNPQGLLVLLDPKKVLEGYNVNQDAESQ